MGSLDENELWKPYNDEVILLKCFDMCSWTLYDVDEIVKAWALALLQNWWLSGCDTIPTLPYNHDTRILGRAWLEGYIP